MFDVRHQHGRLCRPVAAWLCASAFLTAADAHAAPRIAAPDPVYRFGWRDSAETVTNRFVLRNTGDSPLLLTDIRTSCGCSRTEPSSRALAPGEETSLQVQTALRGLHGSLRKSVTVISNDPDTPYLTLWIEGEARAAVCLEPENVSFGRVNPHDPPAPIKVQLAGYLTNLTVTAASSDNPAFAVTVEPDGRTLNVQPPDLRAPGACRGTVRVALCDPSQPALTLHLYAWLDDALRVVPSALSFQPGAAPASTRVVIVRPGTAPRMRITEALIEGCRGEAKAFPRPDGSYQIAVERLIPDTLTTNAALVIRTDLPDRPEWRVPLRREGHAP